MLPASDLCTTRSIRSVFATSRSARCRSRRFGSGEEQTRVLRRRHADKRRAQLSRQTRRYQLHRPSVHFACRSPDSDIPWAVGDAFGDPALESPPHAWPAARSPPASRPASVATACQSGNVFTTLGTINDVRRHRPAATVTTIVRTNFIRRRAADYNDNGVVDAADYVLWRNANGPTAAGLAADGNNDGIVNQADYDLWRSHFGEPARRRQRWKRVH